MLNIPERVHALRPFHVEQFSTRRRIAVFQFFDGAPLEPQPAATAGAGLHLNAGHFCRLELIITCWAIHTLNCNRLASESQAPTLRDLLEKTKSPLPVKYLRGGRIIC